MLVTFALLSVPPIETWSPLPVTLNVPSSFTPPVVVSVAPSPKLNVALRAISTDLTEADVVRLSLPLSMTATSPDAAAVPVLQSPGLPVQLPLPFQKSVAIARSSCDVGPKPTGSGISPPGSCRDGSRCAHRVSPTPAHRREQARRPCVYAVFGRLQARVYVVKLQHCRAAAHNRESLQRETTSRCKAACGVAGECCGPKKQAATWLQAGGKAARSPSEPEATARPPASPGSTSALLPDASA